MGLDQARRSEAGCMNNTMLHPGILRNMASLYLRRDDQLLLLYRQGSSIVSNLWIGSAGGHFQAQEFNNAKACVLRELMEELSIEESALKDLSLRYVTLRYTDGEIRQNYYFFADLVDPAIDTPQSNEGITQWYPIACINSLPMPFTARFVLNHYVNEGQFNRTLYGGIADTNNVFFHKL